MSRKAKKTCSECRSLRNPVGFDEGFSTGAFKVVPSFRRGLVLGLNCVWSSGPRIVSYDRSWILGNGIESYVGSIPDGQSWRTLQRHPQPRRSFDVVSTKIGSCDLG